MKLGATLAISLTALALAAAYPAYVHAKEDPTCPLHSRIAKILQLGETGRFAGPLSRLELTDEQKSAVANVLAAHRDQVPPRVDAWLTARERQSELVHENPLDEAAIRQACRESAAAEEELVVAAARVLAQVRPILTDDQRLQLKIARPRIFAGLQAHLPILREKLALWIDANAGQ